MRSTKLKRPPPRPGAGRITRRAPVHDLTTPLEHASDEALTWLLRAILVTGAEDVITWNTRLFKHLELAWLDDDDVTPAARLKFIHETLVVLEHRARIATKPRSGVVFDNVARLGDLLGLDQVERDLLTLAKLSVVMPTLAACFDQDDGWSPSTRAKAVAGILGRRDTEVREALRLDGSLATLGLLQLGPTRLSSSWFNLREDLDSILLQEHETADDLLRNFVRRAAEPELSLAGYPHLAGKIELLRRALEGALRDGAYGFHILLHGAAGVGKTQLARALARSLKGSLLEVSVEDGQHVALDHANRLGAFQVCQRYGTRFPGSLVLFDELEDCFEIEPSSLMLGSVGATDEKGFTNRLLEGTRVPTIWCANQLEGLDPAFLSHFALVVELTAPPPAVREEMLTRHLDGLGVDPRLIKRIASSACLTPSDCEHAARVAKLSRPRDAADAGDLVTKVLDLRFEARGERGLEEPLETPAAYSLRYVRADLDLAALATGLGKRRRGSLLLHGIPGAGKTAWARHLAESLQMPLVVRYGSDLLDKYVGETEKAIASMFELARTRRAVLFLDEADTFLGSRETTQHRWEVSQTNELLLRMESYGGIFLAATNRLAALDPACLRRFGVKVEFKPMHPDQALELFQATLGAAGQPVPTGDEAERTASALRRLPALTPGDFAAVHRRSLTFGLPLTADALLAGLESECRLKPASAFTRGAAAVPASTLVQ